MARGEVINQHYVPQTYLRRFANSSGQIWVYDKSESRAFQTNIRNVAAERRFYDSEDLAKITGNRQYIEKHLSNLEGHYDSKLKVFLRSLDFNKFRKIAPRERHFFSAYLVVQMFRTKKALITRQQIVDAGLAIQKKAYNDIGQEPPSDEELLDGRTVQEMARQIQHHEILNGDNIQKCAGILYRHIWIIQKAFEGEEFITSDHPFVKRGHITDSWRSMDGIASEGIEILFPLSPKYMLRLVDRNYFGGARDYDGKLKSSDCYENMIYDNQFQIKQSNRFVFSHNGDFDFVKLLIKEEPIHGESNRKRVETNHDEALGRGDVIN